MRPYFAKMPDLGKELKENRRAKAEESRKQLEAVEAEIAAALGLTREALRGELEREVGGAAS